MPTKHIDESTAAELDELYVQCVTLTQQPVKEVEVLRLAIQKGIRNITDDDILSAMSAKDAVWKGLAEMVWDEVIACCPLGAIPESNFDALAEAHSNTWQRFPSDHCRNALYAWLQREHIQLHDPMKTTDEILFPQIKSGMTADEKQAAQEERKRLDGEYVASLPALDGKLYSVLSSHELDLTHHYRKRVSFEPVGNGDFVVRVSAGN